MVYMSQLVFLHMYGLVCLYIPLSLIDNQYIWEFVYNYVVWISLALRIWFYNCFRHTNKSIKIICLSKCIKTFSKFHRTNNFFFFNFTWRKNRDIKFTFDITIFSRIHFALFSKIRRDQGRIQDLMYGGGAKI